MRRNSPSSASSDGLRVRRLRVGDDVTAAAELLLRFFAEEGFDTPADTIARRAAEMAANDACGLFLAEEAGVAIGVATVSLEFGIEFGWSGEMGDLYVVPERRGKGCRAGTYRRHRGVAERARRYRLPGHRHALRPAAPTQSCYYMKLGFKGEGRLILRKTL